MWGRLRQVWYYARPHLADADRAWALGLLNEAQRALFAAMGPQDQAHAVRVARRLEAAGAPGWVLEAALLHDCAKPAGYTLFWRVVGVLASPWLAHIPASPPLSGYRRWLQIYRWHDEYGLQLATEAGTHPEAIALMAALERGVAVADPAHAQGAPAWLEPLKRCDDLG